MAIVINKTNQIKHLPEGISLLKGKNEVNDELIKRVSSHQSVQRNISEGNIIINYSDEEGIAEDASGVTSQPSESEGVSQYEDILENHREMYVEEVLDAVEEIDDPDILKELREVDDRVTVIKRIGEKLESNTLGDE